MQLIAVVHSINCALSYVIIVPFCHSLASTTKIVCFVFKNLVLTVVTLGQGNMVFHVFSIFSGSVRNKIHTMLAMFGPISSFPEEFSLNSLATVVFTA